MLSDFNFKTRFGILSSWRIFLTPKLKKIEKIAPYRISKTSTILRGSLHLTDRAQISYTVFWYHKAAFETWSLGTFQKRCFPLHPTADCFMRLLEEDCILHEPGSCSDVMDVGDSCVARSRATRSLDPPAWWKRCFCWASRYSCSARKPIGLTRAPMG